MLRGVIHQGSHRGQLFVGGRRHCIGQVCAKKKEKQHEDILLALFFSTLFLFFSGQNIFSLLQHVFLGQSKGGFFFFVDDSSVQWQRFFVLTGGQGANVLFPGTVVCFYRGHTLGHLGLYLCGRLLLRVVLLLVVLLLFLQLG